MYNKVIGEKVDKSFAALFISILPRSRGWHRFIFIVPCIENKINKIIGRDFVGFLHFSTRKSLKRFVRENNNKRRPLKSSLNTDYSNGSQRGQHNRNILNSRQIWPNPLYLFLFYDCLIPSAFLNSISKSGGTFFFSTVN